MSDVNAARGEAKAAVIEQLLHCKLNRNKNGTYNHDEIAKVEIIIKRVLKGIYNDEEDGQGMSKLMEATPNNINQVHTNKVITWKAVIQQSADEAAEATAKATKRNAAPTNILPMITEREDARKEAECQNITNQSIVGTKEGVIKSLIRIVGGGVLDAITMSPDGSDYRSIDDYTLHELMQVAIDHASRPEVDDVREMLMNWYDTEFDFRKSIHLNMQALKEAATRIAQFGIPINEPELTLILLAELQRAEKHEWGREFQTAMSNIKKLYKYDHVHDKKSLAAIMKECAAADSARSMKAATAPGEAKAVGKSKASKSSARSILSDYTAGAHDDLSLTWSGGSPVWNKSAYRSDYGNHDDERSYAASSTTTEASVQKPAAAVDCKYCKKYKRTTPHPAKVPVEKCMFNKNYVGFRFAPICKVMNLEYIAKDKFTDKDKGEWPKHKKKEATEEAVSTPK